MLGRIIDYVIDLICDTFTSIPTQLITSQR